MENVGFIHGRFQPFHNGHMAYAEAALSLVDTLFIGITACFPNSGWGWTGDIAPDRSSPSSNPLTYFERHILIETVSKGLAVKGKKINVLPFPIENPTVCSYFVPTNIRCFTTIKEKWNREKISVLKSAGYQPEILDLSGLLNNRTVATGNEVRQMIRNNDTEWEKCVPDSASRFLAEFLIDRF